MRLVVGYNLVMLNMMPHYHLKSPQSRLGNLPDFRHSVVFDISRDAGRIEENQ